MSKKHKRQIGIRGRGAGNSLPQKMQSITVDLVALLRQLQLPDPTELIKAIEKKRGGTRVICLVYNDAPPIPTMLMPAVVQPLSKILLQIGKIKKLDLFLRSTGGIAEVPWRVVTLLREYTEELGVIVPSIAFSGATHIAISADDLVLTPFSMLGSVDPTRNHPLLPKDSEGKTIPMSVQDLKHCIEFIREQLGDSYPSQNLALIISELFKYVNPLAIGALEQAYNLSKLITRKVLKTRRNPLPEEQVKKIVKQLAGDYFSHSFPISRAEVEEDLGLPVVRPDAELLDLICKLEVLYTESFKKAVQATPAGPQPFFQVGGFMQTVSGGWVIGQLVKDGTLLGDQWIELPQTQQSLSP